ncbi:hypothetical protein BLNAU_16462 [Blattamonas nauphoetae]|uniref:Uncharacterized protein n=1 Tax=Blattamonas nauphoetae TaxID=2049346 RepID=A0ABQ9X888_9EUKA|nr:hypothetical protein BLNAU_16462 [Blattamonas nauphoetae]
MESDVRTIADLKEQLTKQQQLNQYEHLAMRAKKEGELAELLVEEQSVHWQMWALQIEKVQILKETVAATGVDERETEAKEKKREIEELKQIVQQMETEMARRREFVRVKYRRRSDFRYAQI